MHLPRQEEITKAVCKKLKELGWKIIGTHHPGASGGIRLSAKRGVKHKNLRAVIPDIIAVKGNRVLLVESTSRFTPTDVSKLKKIAETSGYLDDMRRVAGLGPDTSPDVVLGLAFSPLGREPPLRGMVIFHYVDGAIYIATGEKLLL